MNIRELTIGNYIIGNGGRLTVINRLDYDDTNNITINGKNISEFATIHLTRDIICKCGFREIKVNEWRLSVIENELAFEIFLDPFKFQICIFKTVYGGEYEKIYIDRKNIKSLHQLQNIYFAITGEALKIEPPLL